MDWTSCGWVSWSGLNLLKSGSTYHGAMSPRKRESGIAPSQAKSHQLRGFERIRAKRSATTRSASAISRSSALVQSQNQGPQGSMDCW